MFIWRDQDIPVVINISYNEYHTVCLQGKKVGEYDGKYHDEQIVCPKCLVGALIFTRCLVDRYLVCDTDHIIPIRLARCTSPSCKARIRVLPREALPYKVFAVQIIAKAIAIYRLEMNGLRKSVRTFLPFCRISYVTLWYWTAGLGERMLDQLFLHKDVHGLSLPNLPPVRAILQQTSQELEKPDLIHQWREPLDVPAQKYRSQHRHDQLRYVFKFLSIACSLFPNADQPLMEWQNLIGPFFGYVPLWMFLTHVTCTTFEHPYPGVPHVVFTAQTVDRNDIHEEKKHGCRSPPRGLLALRTDTALIG